VSAVFILACLSLDLKPHSAATESELVLPVGCLAG
jgi:hypothetical protein